MTGFWARSHADKQSYAAPHCSFTTMLTRSLIFSLLIAAPAAAYTKKDKEDAIKWITEEKGFPHLAAFDMMTPKMLKTMMTNYLNLVAPGAFEHLTPIDIEAIWTATSAANNCEICLSFHAGALLGAEYPADEVATMTAGGVPKEKKLARLVMAAKYALAHKGILLEREKKHLASMGFSAEELVEVTYLVGQMAGLNLLYVHMIAEGVTIESFLKGAGPFKDTVYKAELAKAEL